MRETITDTEVYPCNITPREREILQLISTGLTANKEIAKKLNISTCTVGNHLTHIADKLSA